MSIEIPIHINYKDFQKKRIPQMGTIRSVFLKKSKKTPDSHRVPSYAMFTVKSHSQQDPISRIAMETLNQSPAADDESFPPSILGD